MEQINIINMSICPRKQASTWEKIMMDKLNLPIKMPKIKKGMWLHWIKPAPNCLKLNVDGAFKDTMGAVGGILRDEHGNFKMAFWGKVDTNSIDETEIRAVMVGIEKCTGKGYTNISVETDSINTIKLINEGMHSYNLTYEARKCKNPNFSYAKIYREQNHVADALAKNAKNGDNWDCTNLNQIPKDIRKLVYLDSLGLDYYRR
ncbi:hypothetical protein CASFOL_019100 [Castilleja foliolosa]|uniref:RNase H type-1 domain-containing protein n=1 Tax=Castilleja foliolosa TaxID=1961234 RepID=A0ABD3D3F0_9LAMI